MKICLVSSPPFSKSSTQPYINLGLISLMAVLEKNSYCDAEIVDINLELHRGSLIFDEDFYINTSIFLQQKKADVYAFSTVCSTYIHTINIAKMLKGQIPQSTIIFGGPQATVTDMSTLAAFPFIDFIVRGEGEYVLLELINHLMYKTSVISEIGSVTWRDSDNQIIKNDDAESIKNLDDLPIPAYYHYQSIIENYVSDKPDSIHSYIPIDTGRGCPGRCSFCYSHSFWKKSYRFKSPERIVEEIQFLQQMFGVKRFYFPEDMFTADKKRLVKFCQLAKNTNLNIEWTCYARADSVNAELLQIMANAGCRHIYYGIESGSEKIQKSINKNLNLRKVREVVKITLDFGIKTTTSFIVGFPEETYEDFKQTMEMFLDFIALGAIGNIHGLGVLSGTSIYASYQKQLSLNQWYINDHNRKCSLLNQENIDLIKQYPDIFSFFYCLELSNNFTTNFIKNNFIKLFRLELTFSVFHKSIKFIYKNIEFPQLFFTELEKWCELNDINNKGEWLDNQIWVNEFANFLKIISNSMPNKEVLKNMINTDLQLWSKQINTS
jgi:radical SAM superfamily enzyme YgiQ (UPF0313 family)